MSANKGHILITDDTEAHVDVLVGMLADDYDVSVALDGETALRFVEECPPDLILLDIMMPGLSGYEVCTAIKTNKKTSSIPILFLTALTDQENESKGLELGALDYITKPYNPSLVKARVRNHLQLKKYQDHLEKLVEQRTRDMEEAIVRTLQAQIQPHFLYNSINTIACQCRENPDKARELLVYLGTFLRNCFDRSEEFIPLRKELELITAYLSLEQARFANRLQVHMDVGNIDECILPVLILQPLVENAVRHGIFPKTYGGTVSVTCHLQDDAFVVSVKDDGVGMPIHKVRNLLNEKSAGGIGLKNVDARLKRLYGTGLQIDSQEDVGTVVAFTIPCKDACSEKLDVTERTASGKDML